LDCGDPPTSFYAWLVSLFSRLGPTRGDENIIRGAVRKGVEQCLRFGVTTVGDISRECRITRSKLSAGPLRVVSYGEVQAMSQRRVLLDERFAPAAEISEESEWLRIGISPHAPYSIEPFGYTKCLQFARKNSRPIATHLAENPEEAEFLAEHIGPFRELWDNVMMAWDDAVPRYSGGPIRFAKSLGLLDYPTLLAHVNYCDEDEMQILSAGKTSAVYCPRTHRFFGHPPHRWREMLRRGINVAIGTDSCASSPDLNLVDDIRLVHQIAPDFPVEKLWEMITTRAAHAIGLSSGVGAISPGLFADFSLFPVSTEQPLLEILENSILPSQVWIGGNLTQL
jgi:cytosine/adenosine deaminase-related metal-dependent hydrolase